MSREGSQQVGLFSGNRSPDFAGWRASAGLSWAPLPRLTRESQGGGRGLPCSAVEMRFLLLVLFAPFAVSGGALGLEMRFYVMAWVYVGSFKICVVVSCLLCGVAADACLV